jgi:integrase
MAKVWKRKDRDIWIVDYRDATGKRCRKVGGVTREEAELVSAQLTISVAATMKRGTVPVHPDQDITLHAYADRWLNAVRPRLAQRTHASYTSLLTSYILPSLGSMKLREVRPVHVMQLLEEKRLTLGKNTVRLIKATLSTMFRRAVKHELVPVNPALGDCEALDDANQSLDPEVNSMSHDQLAQFKQTMQTMRQDGRLHLRWLMLFSLLAGTGLRPSEALALRTGDLDLTRKRLSVKRALDLDGSEKLTKTKRQRTVDLSDALVAQLGDYRTWVDVEAMAHGRDSLWLFRDDAGHVIVQEQILYHFRKILKQAGLPHFTPYDLRHTFASLLLSSNVPLLYVAKMLGHSKATTTLKYYATWMPDEERPYVNLLDKTWHQTLAPKTEVIDHSGEDASFRLTPNQVEYVERTGIICQNKPLATERMAKIVLPFIGFHGFRLDF